ncbi:MAG TPA: shikimate dehydrogenase [Methanomicrobia archaeon]|nr:shikimate dehydrogenase [Methanomicrobia archaeon]
MKQVYGILGDPVAHSLSPVMQNAAFKQLGMDAVYLAFRVPREELEGAIRGAKSLGIAGLNVTIPLKEDALLFVEPDEFARQIGAINTIDFSTGTPMGYNTDGPGVIRALQERVGDLAGKRVLIIGAGGAARAIAFALDREGAFVTLANRTVARAAQLAARLTNAHAIGLGAELKAQLKATDIMINATSIGMHPRVEETPVTADMLTPELVVFDIVYNPIETKLLADARRAGVHTLITGVKMLVYQGAAAFRIWTKREPPLDVMEQAVLDALQHGLWTSREGASDP